MQLEHIKKIYVTTNTGKMNKNQKHHRKIFKRNTLHIPLIYIL